MVVPHLALLITTTKLTWPTPTGMKVRNTFGPDTTIPPQAGSIGSIRGKETIRTPKVSTNISTRTRTR